MTNRRTLTGCLFLLAASLMAQDVQWQADLPAVPLAGMYAVVLGPEFMGRSRSDLGDVRILDASDKEVPYVLQGPKDPTVHSGFEPYTLLRNEVLPFRTVIELERPSDREMDELHIRVRPAEVAKHVRITGSDDGINWYMVKDEHLVSQGARGDPPYQVLSVNVPRSDHRYYRITMNDSLTPPMQVLDVGRYVIEEIVPPRRIATRTLSWVQIDSLDNTRIHVWSIHPMAIDRITFELQDDAPFRRSGMVVTWKDQQMGRGNSERSKRSARIQGSFMISSDKPYTIEVPGLRADTFMLVIDNGNDRPLRFKNINADVVEHVLLAQLDASTGYRLVTGRPDLPAPKYDMVHFLDELPVPRDTLLHSSPMAMARMSTGTPAFAPEEWWVWAIIIPLIGGMAYMAMKMLRQQGNERDA